MRSAKTLLAEIHSTETLEKKKDKIALLILLCVNIAETFTNLFFTIKARESSDQSLIALIDNELGIDTERGIGLKAKLNRWPPKVLGKSINWSSGAGLAFENLRSIRNRLMHFTSAHENVSVGNIHFVGLSDTSVFDNLGGFSPDEALNTVIAFISHILLISGANEKDLPGALHSWLGLVPEKT